MKAPWIRAEEPSDEAAIHHLNCEAFGGQGEADLVDRLRRDGDLVLSLVADLDGIVGHVAFSRLASDDPALRAVALAPLAVTAIHRRQRIGEALVRDGLTQLGAAGEHLVLVLGEPAYYTHFGFTAEAAQAVRTPYDGPYLQALALAAIGRKAAGPLRYARAFADLA